ncbi:hypothetical protein [Advenella sp. EE-W14]|uniref:hypothetical protein n=1 Tax=Advenella sp. EE-W14 TaxID=2722705 RepID=UPI00145FAF41|nr:hypothetical protein [Advenella sp. EE-W14]
MKITYKQSAQLLIVIYLPIMFLMWHHLVYGGTNLIGATTLMSIIGILFFFLFIKKQKIDKNTLPVYLFFIYCLLYIHIHLIIVGNKTDMFDRDLYSYHLTISIYYLISYTVGQHITKTNNKILLLFYLLISIKIFSNIDGSTFSINLSDIDNEKRGVYLVLADIFSLFSFIIISSTSSFHKKIILFTVSTIILFYLNSRATLYIFIFVNIIYFIFFFKTKKIISLIFIAIPFFLYFSDFFNYLIDINERMLFIFSSPMEDASHIARVSLSKTGFARIYESPIIGDYGGVIETNNHLGTYIHNIFSYWQTYGFIALICSLYFFIYQPIYTISKIIKTKKTRDNNFPSLIFCLSLYLPLMIILAKSYTWHYAWFCLGAIHKYLSENKINIKSNK